MMEFYLCRGAEKNVEMECEIPETWIDWVAHRSEQVSIHCGPLVDSNVEKELNVKETKPLLNELTSLLASSYNVENILTSLHAGSFLRIKRFVTVSSTRPSNGNSHVIQITQQPKAWYAFSKSSKCKVASSWLRAINSEASLHL